MRIIYMGTPEFAVPPLRTLIELGHEVLCVVTQPDKPKDRGKKTQPTPVKEVALQNGLMVLQPERIKDNDIFYEQLKLLEPDLAVVTAYGKILPPRILELPRLGCINIHASLLPELRGAAPIQRAILDGFPVTGVTIMEMEEGLDSGPMLAKKQIIIGNRNASALHDALSILGAELLAEILPEIENGTVVRTAQEDAQATYAPMIAKQTGLVDFRKSAEEIERQIRGLDPWPSAYSFYQGVPVKFKNAEVLRKQSEKAPGTLLNVSKEGMEVACGKGVLLIKSVQFPNKKAMTVEEYRRGNELKEGVILGEVTN